MATIKIIDPVSRIEGHMKVEVSISKGKVTDAEVSGTLFRGFENILVGRVPDDAPLISQRICGVCPVSHSQASVLALENVSNWKSNDNGRILRNLILGANFIQSHILHFYLLSAVDFVSGPATSPWSSYWGIDMRPGLDGVRAHFTDALNARRKADEMAAIFGGKIPHAASYIAGGMTPGITDEKINLFRTYLNDLMGFINNKYIPDVQAVAEIYSDYFHIGVGYENILCFGVFEEKNDAKLFAPGVMEKGSTVKPFNADYINEHVTNSWYKNTTPAHPSFETTEPLYPKSNAYSWIKSPRYEDKPFEVGPLARMKINGKYNGGISTMDRHLARSEETKFVAEAMLTWLNELNTATPYDKTYTQSNGPGQGLTEAPRGALGHWANIVNGKVANYQVISPTCWNASPRDDFGIKGPMEQALIGTNVIDESKPVEVLRIIHSFDPCLACAVHVIKPKRKPVIIKR